MFKYIDKILAKSGLYEIGYEAGKGYTVEYWFPDNPDAIYKVIKGHDANGFRFDIWLDADEKHSVYLKQGDILLFECEYEDKVWFTCTTMLIGAKVVDPDFALGVASYGGIETMLVDGLIEKAVVL